jgi:hypothetical protein
MSTHYEDYGPDESDQEQESDFDCLNNYWIWATESAIEEADHEDRCEALIHGRSDRTSGAKIPFHPLFPADFLRRVGGAPTDAYTVPKMALEDWLQTNFFQHKERPTFDYLIGLLEDEFPIPAPRVRKAIAWLQKMKEACPPWPARWEIKGWSILRVVVEPERPADNMDGLPPAPVTLESPIALIPGSKGLEEFLVNHPKSLMPFLRNKYKGAPPRVVAGVLAALHDLGMFSLDENQTHVLNALVVSLQCDFERQSLNKALTKIRDGSQRSEKIIASFKKEIIANIKE